MHATHGAFCGEQERPRHGDTERADHDVGRSCKPTRFARSGPLPIHWPQSRKLKSRNDIEGSGDPARKRNSKI